MTERHVRRRNVVALEVQGGVGGVLDTRRRRGKVNTKAVVEYFGENDDTPAIELLKSAKPNTQRFREGNHIHVSDVISKCLRKIALMRRMKSSHPTERIMEGQGITFAIGDAIHAFVKARFVKGHPEKVWARWACACGESSCESTFAKRPIKKCPHCHTAVDIQHEVAFTDAEYDLTGAPDITLWLDEYGAFYVVEVKSMAAAEWKELVRPKPDHVVQVVFYWYLLRKLGFPVVNRCSVLYTNKEYSFKYPYKEFMIEPDVESILGSYIESLEILKEADNGGPLPARSCCTSIDSAEAKKCAVCVTCFGCD